jgi:hypothetical protein
MADGIPTATTGRAIAIQVQGRMGHELRERGWEVDELRGVSGLYAIRDFESVDAAISEAELDLPPGTPVRWSDQPPRRRVGGFIVGRPGVGPGIAGPLPAVIVWPRYPDGIEAVASSWAELAELLRERLDWLVELASSGSWPGVLADKPRWSEAEISEGRERALAAINALERELRLSPEISGPFHDVRCSAFISPKHELRWTGFTAGWLANENEPASHGYPILLGNLMIPDYDGEAHRIYRRAVEEGIAARAGTS